MKTGTFAPVSNTATWRDTLEIYDDVTGTPFDLGNVDEITLKLRDIDSESIVLSGSLTGGEKR